MKIPLSIMTLLATLLLVGCDKVSEFANEVQKNVTQPGANPPPEEATDDSTKTSNPEVKNSATPSAENPKPNTVPGISLPVISRKSSKERMENFLSLPEITDAAIQDVADCDEIDRKRITELKSVSATVTAKGIAVFAAFPDLVRLSFKGVVVTSEMMQAINQISSLQELSFEETGIKKGAIVDLNHTGLKILNLNFSEITDADLAVLDNLPELEEVYLERCHIDGSGLQNRNNLARLKVFSAGFTEVGKAGNKAIASMTGLEVLRLSNTKLDDRSFPPNIKLWPQLRELDLSNNSLTDQGMLFVKQLSALERADFSYTQISNPTLGNMRGCRKLKYLKLEKTRVGSDAMSALQKIIKGLEIET